MRKTALPALLAAAALLLTACGTTEDAAEAAPADTAAAGGPITITDDRGTVELDAPATKVVSLEWGLTENLLTLGITPVGAADVKGYNTWDTSVPLDESTPDVGFRGEPSLDAISALEPDLVVTTTDLPAEVIEQIEAEYPVIALRGSDASDPIGKMRSTIEILGEATGTSDAAQAALDEFDAKVEDAKGQLDEAGVAGASFTMADGWLSDGAVSIRMYTPGSFLGAVADEIGLTNAWTGEGDPDYGLAQTDVEGLTELGDVHFLYVGNDTEGGDPFKDGLTGNAIWEQLPFVVAGKTTRLPDGIWMFGGPESAAVFIDATVAALTA
ncbi:ABC transporter substrate-binding protein [Cellulomonas fengjieae]|uniref:Iron-siderophore ABC transporter substrate-binding protein n=1 Tax=Cellulomonas fengjieae TaxID=2819978 RepID=A0ABS3SHM1_9CELL|nr:iron-siderophore ABC transporter substrate-binding protein [Cellulomonas fengjieae]MBO3085241.1 iron-siderophore ABC transporter substrate-binding protein [Cellulomonas fengjieae]QVI66194.1 iron-siderophore ABC transporter substrate-binding protein [Cellulomonas fengjieae]